MVFKFRTFSISRNSGLDEEGRRFSLSQLQAATRNFTPEYILGQGASGIVYKGRLRDGSCVAIKRLRKGGSDKMNSFDRETEVAGLARHPNLLPLLGYCSEGEDRLLVYSLMANNSLACQLERRSGTLDWARRRKIALGAARGLAHLHEGCNPGIIHRDVNSSNVLLDRDFEPVLGDYGLARIMRREDLVYGTIEWCDPGSSPSPCRQYEDTYVNTAVRGHMSSIAPEYVVSGRCTQKSDVFAFGNMLLQIVTGKIKHYRLELGEYGTFLSWIREQLHGGELGPLVDPDLQGNYNKEEAKQLVQLGLMCADVNPNMRPKMSQVVAMLEGESLDFSQMRSRSSSSSSSSTDSTLYYSFPPSPVDTPMW